jgi:hypothetical protein
VPAVKLLAPVALCVPLLVAGCGSPAPAGGPAPSTTTRVTSSSEDEISAVRAAFDSYTKAALAKNGIAAEDLLAETIGGYYETARKMALTGSTEQVAALPLAQRLTVYVLRGKMDAAMLRGSTSADVVRAAFDLGLISENGVSKLALGEVAVDGGTASAAMTSNGKVGPYKMRFLKENGRWKVDLLPMLTMADETFAGLAEQQGVTPDELIDQLLVSMFGQEKALVVQQPLEG